ncbi:glycosyltransferase [Burkholderia multivorans]|uniref:glycosyltransferase n=1 Tax=Burkholderia multivorans TaxID=87883 RepID=UPI001C24BFBB|nr:glycosyltransferase [Burkholderia multivorans]MBU9227188.1 glycosyltransferase [Burkholderia multivorans]MBU9313193.1 glycosyltransferase [Burkholderia multivorans]MCA8247701.1 glycosyltransferase [Burkholderia multivorans]
MATVSVIVPFFNQLKYLRQCLESVLQQTFTDIEVLLVNDGSAEDPAELVRELDDPRITLIEQANAGVAIARNNAIATSSGEALVFLDADDWLAPTMIEELLRALIDDTDAGMAYCDIVRVNEHGDVADGHKVAHARTDLNGNILPSLILGGYFPPVCVMVRASALDAVGTFDKSLGGCCDWDLWIRMAASGFTARFVPRDLAYYRLHDQSMSKDAAHMRATAEATLAKNMAAFPKQLAGAMQLLIQTSAEIYSTNVALEQEQLRLVDAQRAHEHEIERLEGIVQELKDGIESLTQGKQWLEEQWSTYKSVNVALEHDKQRLAAALAEHRAEIERLEGVASEFKDEIESLTQGKQWLEEQWSNYKTVNVALEQDKQHLGSTLAEQVAENERLETMTSKLRSEINELTSEKERLEKKLEECREINAAIELENRNQMVSLRRQKARFGLDLESVSCLSAHSGRSTLTMLIKLFQVARRRATGLAKRLAGSPDMPVDEAELLRTSPLFDGAYYLAAYPDVADAAIDPIVHYLQFGWREARQPSMSFDGNRYLNDYPDVRAADINPLVHYLAFGRAEGRHAASVIALEDPPTADEQPCDSTACDAPVHSIAGTKEYSPEEVRQIIEQSGLFDLELYCRLNPDLASLPDPLEHYVKHGGFEGRRAHRFFDGRWYTWAYPDVAASGMHPLVHYMTIGLPEGRHGGLPSHVLGTIEKMVAEAGELEPGILLDPAFVEPALLGFSYGGQSWSGIGAWQRLFDSLPCAFEHIVFVPWLVRGGADLAATNVVRASIQKNGIDSTLIVLTDYDRSDAIDWLPAGTHLRIFSEIEPSLTRADRVQLVESLILALRPKSVMNVNSAACWDAIAKKGGALGKLTELYACLFCRDYTPDGRAAGYADTHFRDCIPYLTKVYFDNAGFMDELAVDYGIPAGMRSKLVTLHQPVGNVAVGTYKGGPQGDNRVMWAGRFCKQKNVDLLIEIVRRAPEFHFDVYGYGDDAYVTKLAEAERVLGNLTVKGPFSSTASLPVNHYNAFLYTSLWDGLPLTLADIACTGIPMVASAVGGIPDLVTEQTGWLIQSYKDADPYVAALRDIIRRPDEARVRAGRMIDRVRSEHSWEQFCATLRVSPSFIN